MSQSKIKVITLFTGIGAQEAALKRLNIPFEVVGISEIDKYAIQSYNAINGPTFNYGDITKIPLLDYADLWTYSFPCQDFSVAGLGRGGDAGSGTRSSLLWEVERIIRAVKPKYLLMENVKNLVGEKHKHNFIKWIRVLEGYGYQNFWKVLNAKDYGVPQNRERVFVVSIRKLTPLECWRLMDFTDEEFYAAQLSGISNSQLYKQAGNSIVVAVLQAIFKELLA